MAERIDIGIDLDLQGLYDRARVVGDSWHAMADNLARSGRVCVHPTEKRVEVAGVVVCSNCQVILDG